MFQKLVRNNRNNSLRLYSDGSSLDAGSIFIPVGATAAAFTMTPTVLIHESPPAPFIAFLPDETTLQLEPDA